MSLVQLRANRARARFHEVFIFYTVMNPSPSSTENTKIATMQIGAIYLIMTRNKGFLLNSPELSISSMITFGLII